MLKKSMKVLTIILVVTLAIAALSQTVFAGSFSGGNATWDNVNNKLKNASGNIGGADNKVANMAEGILSIVQVVGMAVAVIMLVVLAIKYIAASPSDKAEIKKHAVVYVVGAVILFAATGILQIVKAFASNLAG